MTERGRAAARAGEMVWKQTSNPASETTKIGTVEGYVCVGQVLIMCYVSFVSCAVCVCRVVKGSVCVPFVCSYILEVLLI